MKVFWDTRNEIYSEEFRRFVAGLETSGSKTILEMFSGFNEHEATDH
jgi:hypothetical protein